MKRTFSLVAATFIASTLAAQDATVIRNATVMTVTNGTIDRGTVVIRGAKIVAVGPDAQVSVPSGAKVIDGAGRVVFPGIIDSHSHTAVEGGFNEMSLPNAGAVRIADVLTNEDISAYRQLAGGTTAALVLHGSSNAIGGQSAIVKWKWGHPVDAWVIRDAPIPIKFALGENPKSANFFPPTGQEKQYPSTRMGVEEQIRSSMLDARDYMARWSEYESDRKRGETPMPPRRDLLMESMSGILRGEIQVHSHCYRADEILMLIRVADEMGFKIRTFQHVLEGYKVGREIAAHGAGAGTFIDWWGFKAETNDGTPYNVALMTRDGVLVSTNSDSDELARRLNLDAAKAMKYGGLSHDEAIRLITINPAKQLGIAHRVGSIEVGKDADLAIWTGDPLSTFSRVETTFVDGEVVFDRQRDIAARAELAREKAERLRTEAAAAKKAAAATKGPAR